MHRLASELGLKFELEALEMFVQLAGADGRQLRNELEKIDLYLGEQRTVTVEVVRALVAKSTSGVIWELGTCLSKRQLGESLALLEQLIFQGETPIGILYAAIIPTVRNLLVTKDLLVRHRIRPPQAPFHFNSILSKLPEHAIRHLPRRKDGGIKRLLIGIGCVRGASLRDGRAGRGPPGLPESKYSAGYDSARAEADFESVAGEDNCVNQNRQNGGVSGENQE